jgi:putative PIN family toxin of toxin-antitoxin system
MSLLAVYDCMLFFMRAARPERVRETFEVVEAKTVTCCLSAPILAEIHDVLTRPRHQQQFPSLTPPRVSAFLEEITRRSLFIKDVPDVYHLDRDPKDSKYINLAIAAKAPFLVTRDKDMLNLMQGESSPATDFQHRFPALRILSPGDFIQQITS